jgi:peptide/nickel transport system permease protein
VLLWIVVVIAAGLMVRAGRRLLGQWASSSAWRDAVQRFGADTRIRSAVLFLCALAVMAALAHWLAPYDPTAQPDIVALKNRPPSLEHLFGTDPVSRDVFSRVIYGARISLSIALLAVLVAVSIGTAWGACAGYFGGAVDSVLMRLADAGMSIPRVLLLIALLSLWGNVPLPMLVAVLGLTGWFGISRLVRGEVLALRDREMVIAARALGAPDARILTRHILPNVLSPVLVAATLGIGNVIILESGLSYLGIGVQPPAPSWGNIIQEGREQVAQLWWLSLFPGLAILFTVMACNRLGDSLRDAFDPRRAGR